MNAPKTTDTPTKGRFIDNFFEVSVLPIALVCIFLVMFNTSVTSFIAPYSETIGLLESSSYFFIFYVIGLIGTRPIVSKLFDKKGATFVVIPGAIIYVSSFLVLAMVNSEFMLFLAGVLAGIGLGACQNTTNSLALSIAPPRRLGFANATYFAAFDTCASAGPLIAGLMITSMGYRQMLVIAAIWTAIGIPVYLIVSRKFLNKRTSR